MVRTSKVTKHKLAKEDFSPRVRVSTTLEHIVRMADCGCDDRAFYTDACLYYLCYSDEANLFRGLESKYPGLICTTLTYGLNEIVIPDINKLVKAMLLYR